MQFFEFSTKFSVSGKTGGLPKTMTDDTKTLAESYAELLTKSAELGAVTASREIIDVFNIVFAEIASGDLSPTRKEASLMTLRRVVELYAEKVGG